MSFNIRIPTKEERRIEILETLLKEQEDRNSELEDALVELADLIGGES